MSVDKQIADKLNERCGFNLIEIVHRSEPHDVSTRFVEKFDDYRFGETFVDWDTLGRIQVAEISIIAGAKGLGGYNQMFTHELVHALGFMEHRGDGFFASHARRGLSEEEIFSDEVITDACDAYRD